MNTTAMGGATAHHMVMIESVLLTVLITTVTQLVTRVFTDATSDIPGRIKQLLALLRRRHERVSATVTIRYTTIRSGANGYQSTPDDETYNEFLIKAVLERLSNEGVYSDDAVCMLTSGMGGLNDNLAYERSRAIVLSSVNMQFSELKVTTSTTEDASVKECIKHIRTLTITSQKKTTSDIKQFIADCHERRAVRLYSRPNPDTYFYKQLPGKDGLLFKKYKVTTKVGFEGLYFPEKPLLMEMISKLRAGKINKLALLLYGAPGCGKTSIIKALATTFKYPIIEVKLSLIANDAQLTDAFHSSDIQCPKSGGGDGSGSTSEHLPNGRIYVLEDIDAETDVVLKRDDDAGAAENMQRRRFGPPKPPPEAPPAAAGADASSTFSMDSFYKRMMDEWYRDGLTLSGILNVFDGILELNGSIIIMTTNHPDKLDPALIRPGRVNMQLEMRRMRAEYANQMITTYFGEPIDDLPDEVFTPAQLEAFCQLATSIDHLRSLIKGALGR